MNEWSLNRRSVVKVMLLGSAAPWLLNSTAFAGSCDVHVVRLRWN